MKNSAPRKRSFLDYFKVFAISILLVQLGCVQDREVEYKLPHEQLKAVCEEVIGDIRAWETFEGNEEISDYHIEDLDVSYNKEDPDFLLTKARDGDFSALLKLEDYVEYDNPKWEKQLEVSWLRALNSGVSGIASLYSQVLNQKSRSAVREFDEMLGGFESKAKNGSLAHAVFLYQFYGSLLPTDSPIDQDEIRKRSENALQLCYHLASEKGFQNIVRNEKLRVGYIGVLDKLDNFPHTRVGWKPEEK